MGRIKKRQVVYISGTRADYGLMRSTLREISHTKALSLSILVTGMHLAHEFGYTVNEIRRDGFRIYAKIPSLRKEDTGAGMLRSFSSFLTDLVNVLEHRERPDLMLLLGDRWEMLAGAMAGAYMNILVAHIHGGELTGSVDEPNRHAITRFSHLHLVATKQHANLLLRLGEEPSRIHIIGSPGIDDIVSRTYSPLDTVTHKYGIDPRSPHILLVQHPVVTEHELAAAQIKSTLRAIERTGYRTTAIYPNADAGGREMIKVMRRFSKRNNLIRLYRNITRSDYLGLMACANMIVGNSSSGIIEAASFRLPAVNIGTRQQGRVHPRNVIDVDYSETQIYAAMRKAMTPSFLARMKGMSNPYGSGGTSVKVARILSRVKTTPTLLQKRLTFKME